MEKECFKCGIIKQLTDFYKHPQMPDGHLNKCKDCSKKDVKNNYLLNKEKDSFIEKERKRGREKHKRLYSKAAKKYVANYRDGLSYLERYPEKQKCRNVSIYLKKPFEDAERHHWSYNIEHGKDVIWINRESHVKAHRFLVYDQERFMYRRYDNNILLDTRDAHLEFINFCINNL